MRLIFVAFALVSFVGLTSCALSIVQRQLTKNEYNLKWKYGTAQTIKWITIHNTANKASAQNEASYLNNRQDISHGESLRLFLLLSHGWHAGDGNGEGNRASVAIEIAQSTNDNIAIRNGALENGARLAAVLLKRFKFGVDRLRKHQD